MRVASASAGAVGCSPSIAAEKATEFDNLRALPIPWRVDVPAAGCLSRPRSRPNSRRRDLPFIVVLLCSSTLLANDSPVDIQLDSSQVPELEDWGNHARAEISAWYPRVRNLLSSDGFSPPTRIQLTIKKSDNGIGGTVGSAITVHSGWVSSHPGDTGLMIHELVHVIQGYPNPAPGWITEGIADYIRWAIYEGKPLAWFGVPKKPAGYTVGYQGTAGFLLWLESGPAPGIVRSLNRAMRTRTYHDALFETATGSPLPDLWTQYVTARSVNYHTGARSSPARSSRFP